jgi:hypothetical protein
VVVLDGQPELFQVVRALHTTGGFASGLNGREKQTDQNTDDRDDDQKFDKGEALAFTLGGHERSPKYITYSKLSASFEKRLKAPRLLFRFYE